MWKVHLWHLFQRSCHLFVAANGTSNLGFATPILVCLITIGGTLYFHWRRKTGKGFGDWKQDAVVALKALVTALVVVYVPIFVWSIFATVYSDHQFLVSQNSSLQLKAVTLQSELDDRKRSLHLADPATGKMFEVIKTFAFYRRRIGDKAPCQIRITTPRESLSVAATVAQLAWVATSCSVNGPDDINSNPEADKLATTGMQKDLVIFHMAKGQVGDVLYGDLASTLRLKRSYDVPVNSPNNFLWLQFGTGKQWASD